MELGLCTWAFARSAGGRRDLGELTAIAGEAGFARLEGAYHGNGSLSIGRPRPEGLSIPIGSLATLQLHRFSFAAANPRQRDAAHQVLTDMLRCAAAWEIPSVSISPGARSMDAASELGPAQLDPAQLGPAQLADALAPHVELAEELGVSLLLENVPGHLLEGRAAMERLLDAFPSLGLCLDLGNALADPPLTDWWRRFAARIAKIHISDARVGPAWAPVWPGEGDIQWQEVSRLLRDAAPAETYVEVAWDGTTPEQAFVLKLAKTVNALLGERIT